MDVSPGVSMTRRQENRLIGHLNRLFIAGLSLTGMLLDGAQYADVMLGLAIVLWLWMPECRKLEIGILHRTR